MREMSLIKRDMHPRELQWRSKSKCLTNNPAKSRGKFATLQRERRSVEVQGLTPSANIQLDHPLLLRHAKANWSIRGVSQIRTAFLENLSLVLLFLVVLFFNRTATCTENSGRSSSASSLSFFRRDDLRSCRNRFLYTIIYAIGDFGRNLHRSRQPVDV